MKSLFLPTDFSPAKEYKTLREDIHNLEQEIGLKHDANEFKKQIILIN